jgi:hypothetical protein
VEKALAGVHYDCRRSLSLLVFRQGCWIVPNQEERRRNRLRHHVLDHPGNLYTTWHNSSRLWMLNPVITAGGPITLPGGQTFRLRYRVVVPDGDTPTALLEKMSAEWRKL